MDQVGSVGHDCPAQNHENRQAQPSAPFPVPGALRVDEVGMFGLVIGLDPGEQLGGVTDGALQQEIRRRKRHDGRDCEGEEGEEGPILVVGIVRTHIAGSDMWRSSVGW